MTRSPYPVAVVGVGHMGGAMAANLLTRGWPVQVCDLVPERMHALASLGAGVHDHPASAAVTSDATIVCVVDAVQCEQVLFGPQGLALAVPAGHTVLLCPTIAPQDTESLAQRLVARAGDRLALKRRKHHRNN